MGSSRRFIDAPTDMRCRWDVTLRDGSRAQCGRLRKHGDLCTQHQKMADTAHFPCCGGNDELPPDHTMDCQRAALSPPGRAEGEGS
ncbi:hypothetical protein CSC64_06815 [Pseudoxanthomonas koreensis]|nr:hypothetical protein CSC64_06815 [Pseudoxanthomonas koreensis]